MTTGSDRKGRGSPRGSTSRDSISRGVDGVTLTHPERLYWADAGVTKQGLAEYYRRVWPWMEPFVTGRLLALVRCPDGISGQCFFQKHPWRGLSASIRTVSDPHDASGGKMVAIGDLDGLLGLVQGAVLEIHPWQSSLADLERPDQIVMDLDPGDGISWAEMIAAAREVRQRLEDAGLRPFVKLTGGKGLHVVAPLAPKAGWDRVHEFAKGIAEAMAADTPNRFVSVVAKEKRRGKILVDYLRNGRGQTAVAPYSSRARAGAPVAMPLGWDELGGDAHGNAIRPGHFTVANAAERLDNLAADPWEDFHRAAVLLG